MVIQFEENRIRQQEVEVKALTALVQQEVSVQAKMKAVYRLIDIAFPEEVAKRLEEEDAQQTRLGVE